ncbi:putative C-S lyase [Marinomonas mediterranea]|uniref:MalY/PatB family protein n=1 Tax=Marinomonas mediterranea TaxID=119864 RepID=UPI00234A6EF4|nr:PatB family C-S lyase [Marinomonas mediterranea]WCN14524.1 putative C-S lyase [Marinomonas mediterranea]
MDKSVFDKVIDRTHMSSAKWNRYSDDVIPMWVADMDFDSPNCIKTAIQKRVEEGVLGYTMIPESLKSILVNHCQNAYDWQVEANHLIHLPGLVCALHLAARALTSEDDSIIVPGPVYYHLTKAPELANRHLESVPLLIENSVESFTEKAIDNMSEKDRWVIDKEKFETACAAKNAKMIMLCNPHNPGGTVYRREELEEIHALAKKYDLIIVSDEIHCDLILDDQKHIPIASLNEDAAQRTITLMSPSKTYNVAGLGYAFAVIANNQLRTQFNKARQSVVPDPNLLGLVAAEAAYKDGEAWRQELLAYLRKNREFIKNSLKDLPLKMASSEATYLAWIDASELNLDDPYRFFLEAGVATSSGSDFGNSQFIRLNFGCPTSILEQAMMRISKAISTLDKT